MRGQPQTTPSLKSSRHSRKVIVNLRHAIVRTATLTLIAGALAGGFTSLFAQDDGFVPVPELTGRVVDQAGLFSAGERNQLEQKLANLERTEGSQVVVLTVATTQPETIEGYSIRVVEEWQIGRADVDDGVLILVARDDRRMRIEVGYGLEGAIPDAYAKRIISDTMAPRFRNGDFFGGVDAAVDSIAALIAGEELPEASGVLPEDTRATLSAGFIPIVFVVSLVLGFILRAMATRQIRVGVGAGIGVLVVIVGLFIASIFDSLLYGFISFMIVSFSGRGRSGGFFVGGSSGGFSSGGSSFGGFSGGGGSFGGGGASGGW